MNHDAAIRDLHQACIDQDTLRRLFADVATYTGLLEVIPKYAATSFVPEQSSIQLTDGLTLLVTGQVRSLQLRYCYDGATWWDTLMPTSEGTFRIIRIRHDFSPES